MPALPTYLIEPIWEQFSALLPEREVDHPLGCHRSRVPDRVVFEKLVQVLVFGCAYERIADEGCSDTTLRRRRDEWIEIGAMDELRALALEAYDRYVGLELSDIAVDCCITKAPCGGEKAGRSPADRGKRGTKRSMAVDACGIPVGFVTAPANRHDSPLLAETLDAAAGALGELPEATSIHLDRGLRLGGHSQATASARACGRDLQEGQAGSANGHEAVGGGADRFLAQRPQEVGVVHRAQRAGDRLLGGFL